MPETNKVVRRHMLVFDSAYTYRYMKERNVFAIVTGRDLGGYFDHIWTVHPVAGLLEPTETDRYGTPSVHELNDRHTLIEGKFGRYRWLSWFPPLNFALALWGLLRVLRRLVTHERIRIVRAEDPLLNGLLALLFKRRRKRALLIGVWGNPGALRRQTGKPIMPRFSRTVWLEELVERFVLRRADLVMAQNEDNRQFVLEQGVPIEQTAIFRLGNLLHPAHFSDPATRASGSPDLAELGVESSAALLCIARLEELKLVDHVVRVVAVLKGIGREATALFVGDGSFKPTLHALARELGVEQQIVFCGNRDQEWLARVVPEVAVVLSPLTGRALGEAALGGSPVVAYDVDWHSEIVISGKTGELVPYLDFTAMAEATARLLDDPDRAKRLGANLRQHALSLLDPANADAAQIVAYETLLAEQRTL